MIKDKSLWFVGMGLIGMLALLFRRTIRNAQNSEAWREGYAAMMQNRSAVNPHPANTTEHRDWKKGAETAFCDAEHWTI